MSVYTYSEAARIMETARDPQRGKPLQNNTRMYARGFGETVQYAIELHCTDVVTILRPRNGMGTLYMLSTGGWETVTTRDRITTYAPVHRTLRTHHERGWELRLRPDPNDPEPEYGERTIPKPFKVRDPGPEPVKPTEGCIAGTLDTYEYQNDKVLYDWRSEREQPGPQHFIFRKFYADGSGGDIAYRYAGIAAIYYGEEGSTYSDAGWRDLIGEHARNYYSYSSRVEIDGVDTEYKQCPHCAAFAKRHAAWHRAMHGDSYGRGSERGYRQMCEWLDDFGSYEAWHEAYLEDFRTVREQRKAWKAWDARNHVEFFSGIIVDGDGYPLKRQVEQHRKAQRRYEREQRRYERECERRMREEQRRRAFIERAKRAHRDPFVVAAENIVANARTIGVRADESLEEA